MTEQKNYKEYEMIKMIRNDLYKNCPRFGTKAVMGATVPRVASATIYENNQKLFIEIKQKWVRNDLIVYKCLKWERNDQNGKK